jgi:pentatricopeptide repeat protein
VQEVQSVMSKMGMRTTLRTYNTRVHEAAKKGDFARCREIMRMMASAGVNPDVVTYNTIFNGLAKKQQMQECNDLLKTMIKQGVQPDATTYNTIATGWAAHRYFAQALELVAVMRAKQLPTTYALTSVIYHSILSGDVDQGMSLFKQLVAEGNAGVGTYNSVMYSLLNARAIRACEQTYALMRERGVHPDHITYQALAILAKRNGQDILALRDRMREDNVEPNEGMFNTLLRRSKGPASREMELIKEMRSKGLQLEDGVLIKVMKGAAYAGDTQTCTQLLADMRAHGDALTSQLYHLLAVAYMKQNNEEAVWKTVAEMRELKLGPTDETYKALLDFLQQNKNWEKCVALLEEMETNHVLPVGLWQ